MLLFPLTGVRNPLPLGTPGPGGGASPLTGGRLLKFSNPFGRISGAGGGSSKRRRFSLPLPRKEAGDGSLLSLTGTLWTGGWFVGEGGKKEPPALIPLSGCVMMRKPRGSAELAFRAHEMRVLGARFAIPGGGWLAPRGRNWSPGPSKGGGGGPLGGGRSAAGVNPLADPRPEAGRGTTSSRKKSRDERLGFGRR